MEWRWKTYSQAAYRRVWKSRDGRLSSGLGIVGLFAFVVAASMGILGCPQDNKGAVGTDTCLVCHDGVNAPDVSGFRKSAHLKVGCEACHGPGYLHVREGGRGGLFIGNPANLSLADSVEFCKKCHPGEASAYQQSAHFQAQVMNCVECHDIHAEGLTRLSFVNNALCIQCHTYNGFDNPATLEAHTFHPVDPTGTGASRCVLCHMPPLRRTDQAAGPHWHSFKALPPVSSNEAAQAGVTPTPPNSCSGITGCHDGSVITAPVFNVDNPQDNDTLQIIFEQRYGGA